MGFLLSINKKESKMKCKYCSFSTSNKSSLVSHIKTNHRNHVISHSSFDENDTSINFNSFIESSIMDFMSDDSAPSFSGGGGDFGGGGASGSFDLPDTPDDTSSFDTD
jgi:uncharacterized membrane protein YgcG